MAEEIERKFLIHTDLLPEVEGRHYTQGYVARGQNTVRVRIIDDEQAFVTIKGQLKGIKCPEFEYEIPLDEGRNLLTLCLEKPVEKIRRIIEHEGHKWEVDEFLGDNAGLWLAEIELSDENESFEVPDWAGEEVTHDSRYRNSNLALKPYKTWGKQSDRNCSPS